MDPVGVQLATVLQRGARLVFAPDPERPIIRCLSPAARQLVQPLLDPTLRAAAQAVLRHVVTYRRVLLALFDLNARDPRPEDVAEAPRLIAEEMRLVDDLGPTLADAVRAQIAADFVTLTGRCPLCGGGIHED